MTNLRETKDFTILHEDVVCNTISSKGHLTFEEIGNVVMTIFAGSWRLSGETYKKVSLRFDSDPF